MEKKINLREEFKKEQRRLRRIVKKFEKEYEAELIKSPIPDIPKRVTKQSIEKIKAIKPATIKQFFDEQKTVDIPKITEEKIGKTVEPSIEKLSSSNQEIKEVKPRTSKEETIANQEIKGAQQQATKESPIFNQEYKDVKQQPTKEDVKAPTQLPYETDVVLNELYRILNDARTDGNNKKVADYVIEVIEEEISFLEGEYYPQMGDRAAQYAKSIIVKRIQSNPHIIELAQIVAYDSSQEKVNINAIEIIRLVTGSVSFEQSEIITSFLTYGVRDIKELGG